MRIETPRWMERLKPAMTVEQGAPFSIKPNIAQVKTKYANGSLLLASERIRVAGLATGRIEVIKDIELLEQLFEGGLHVGVSLPAGNGPSQGEADTRNQYERLPVNFLLRFDKLTAQEAKDLKCEMRYGEAVYEGNVAIDYKPHRGVRDPREKCSVWVDSWHQRLPVREDGHEYPAKVEVLYPHDPEVLSRVEFRISGANGPSHTAGLMDEMANWG